MYFKIMFEATISSELQELTYGTTWNSNVTVQQKKPSTEEISHRIGEKSLPTVL